MIQVLDRAFAILEYLSAEKGEGVTLSKIEQACSIRKTTLSNILKSLEELGYVSHPAKRKGYSLGYKAFSLAGPKYIFDKLTEVSRDEMKLLSDVFSETVVLASLREARRVVLSVLECKEGITAHISHSEDVYMSATGRVMLAYSSPHAAEAIIGQAGLPSEEAWAGISTQEALRSALAQICAERVAITTDHKEIVGIAVPVLVAGQVVGAIGVCIPRFRCTTGKTTLIFNVLEECANSIGNKFLL
ncbi:MAG: helix-turn-helix domain-containing protein [Bacteroidales bacterium]|nr:helix-turn-helix domain-containing protein [Bacteroidales bacterium]